MTRTLPLARRLLREAIRKRPGGGVRRTQWSVDLARLTQPWHPEGDMLRILFLVAALPLFAGCGLDAAVNPTPAAVVEEGAATAIPVAAEQVPPGSRIAFVETSIDLGDLRLDDEPRDVVFEFRNSGAGVLRVSKLTTSCQCAKASVNAPLFQPAAEGTIEVRIVPDVAGPRVASVTVESNDPARRNTQLLVKWNTRAPLSFEPSELHFGTLLPDATAEEEVRIVFSAPADEAAEFTIGRVEGLPREAVVATLVPSDPATDSVFPHAAIHIALRAGRELGYREGRINLYLGDSIQPSLSIPLDWRVQDVIETAPLALFLGSHFAGEECEKVAIVSSREGEPLEVSEAGLTADGMPIGKAICERTAPNRIVVRVSLDMPDTPGIHQLVLTVKCSQPVERTIKIPVTAFCRGEPADSLSGEPGNP